MKTRLDAFQKSVKNLRHKIVNIEHIAPDGSKQEFKEAEVISVDLNSRGMSIVDCEGNNHILQGGVFRSTILRPAPFPEEKVPVNCYEDDDEGWPVY